MRKLWFLTSFVIMLFPACTSSDRIMPGDDDFAALVSEAARYFRTDRQNIDIHPFGEESGKQGVFRIFNKAIKGDGVLFIVTESGVIAPDKPGYGFQAAATACRLLRRLPENAVEAAELFLCLSGPGFRQEMVIENPARFTFESMKGVITAPAAAADGSGFLLDFWSRNIDTNAFIHYSVNIDRDGNAATKARDIIEESV
jgi:hypothetical protein